jgi:hypothetical protein
MGLETTVAETARFIATLALRNRHGQRQPMACETAAANTVTSASKWPAPPPHANASVPVGRCRYAEDGSHGRCDPASAFFRTPYCFI